MTPDQLAEVLKEAAKASQDSYEPTLDRCMLHIDEAVRASLTKKSISLHFWFPVYIMLETGWNDALHWAEQQLETEVDTANNTF